MLSESILNDAMRRACAEARQWLGATNPNPPVGAVALDDGGRVLASMAHKKAGEAHAEAALIDYCRVHNLLEKVHTLCVTLEPCNHFGKTPPCTDAIIQSGIKYVAYGVGDPNPKVKGGGAERLRQAGIEVASGIAEEECLQLIHVFAYYVATSKPWVTIKRAFNEQGSMIPPPGQKVFTSKESLLLAHRLRKKADAILTGSGTILADKPLFTVRETADFDQKRRFLAILDRRKRVSADYIEAACQHGLDILIYQDLEFAFEDLTLRGARDVLIEAGPHLSQTILDKGLWMSKIDIHKSEPQDHIETGFRDKNTVPFNVKNFTWDYMLPG